MQRKRDGKQRSVNAVRGTSRIPCPALHWNASFIGASLTPGRMGFSNPSSPSTERSEMVDRINGFTKARTCYSIRPPWLPPKRKAEDDA